MKFKAVGIWTACAVATIAFGQVTALYSPVRTLADQGISIRGWGSGTIGEADEVAYEGTRSIRVSTRNFFQGGVMSMTKPVDLGGAYGDKNNLLRFAIKIADLTITMGGGTTGEAAGAAGPGAGVGGGGKGGGVPGGGRPAGGTTTSAEAPTLKNLRFVFGTTDGKKSEIYVPINTNATGERGWIHVAIPLHAINGFADTNKVIESLAISGDATSTFYIGDIRVVNDSTPITGEMQPNQDRNLALGDEVEFRARGFGGASILKYSWDFDARDGIQNDADGQTIKRRFRKAGTYVVTLTISDVYGLKKPYQTKINVKVNP